MSTKNKYMKDHVGQIKDNISYRIDLKIKYVILCMHTLLSGYD